ncbi:MAG TPA: AAA family ATPase [Catalimonadaceae bacterium]|nr:AAA family ATPase [Catalimonadaceae bacterium]
MSNPQIDSLKAALQFSPENQALRKILIQAYLDLLQYEEALEELKKGLQLSPADDGLKMGMAHCYFHLKNYSTAQVILEELLEKGVEVAENTFLLSRVFLANNEIKQAKELYDKAMEIDPDVDDEDFEDQLNEALKNSGLAAMVSYDEVDALLDGIDIEKPTIDFSAIGGLANIKEEIALKVIHPLKHPDIYKAYGKKIGGGILMYGPPGCGKTLIARATAGEIKANFISVGINDVLDMWVGNSEKNLHDVFEQARLNTPCVLFFDEVDAMGASRNDMRKTNSRFLINQFLDELDGVKHSNEGILVLGATNSPWFLDTAFRRPGRFDRIIFVSPPDLQAREEILNLILQEKPTETIDVKAIAKLTEGYSGADLQALLDIAIESKLTESLKQGKVLPISTSDLKNAVSRHRATTKEWFTTAKNYALYSNEGGLYDEILKYLNIKK